MPNRHKQCSGPAAIREMQIKTTVGLTSLQLGPSSKNQKNADAGEVVGKRPLTHVGGNANWYNYYGKQCGDASGRGAVPPLGLCPEELSHIRENDLHARLQQLSSQWLRSGTSCDVSQLLIIHTHSHTMWSTHDGISRRTHEILAFATECLGLEIIPLSEISQIQKDRPCMLH